MWSGVGGSGMGCVIEKPLNVSYETEKINGDTRKEVISALE